MNSPKIPNSDPDKSFNGANSTNNCCKNVKFEIFIFVFVLVLYAPVVSFLVFLRGNGEFTVDATHGYYSLNNNEFRCPESIYIVA